jgi:cytosine/adenosine deaminase-related metal-dependent hydrolase
MARGAAHAPVSDAGDDFTTPGLVNAHHHLYSALARGMPAPPRPPTSFADILELVWWRLDRALDLDLVGWSARLGAVEALEGGTTAIVDHHSSPNAIEGSLDVIADACADVGVRVSCCYEVTDRNGVDGAKAGLAENERYLRAGGRGFVGAHACFTLSDATLEGVAGLASDLGAGVHIHVAEARDDADAGARLDGVAGDGWLLAHAVHLDRPLPGTVAHNARSNLNNGVGYGRPARFERVALGSDGIGSAMVQEFQVAYVAHRADDVTATPEAAWRWLHAGAELWPEVSGDTVTWSAGPMEPWFAAYTPALRPVRVDVDGETVLDANGPTRVDAAEIRAKAAEAARRLWARMEA